MPTRRAASLSLLMIALACSSVTVVEAPTLARVVERDLVAFELPSPPVELVDRLASARAVVVGETHFLREHREFVGELVKALHARGFRQLLMEWPHAFDWVLSDYAAGNDGISGWTPPQRLGGLLIDEVRAFNRTLPVDEQVRLHALDVNLDEYGGAEAFLGSLRSLVDQLEEPGPVATFLGEAYGDADRQQRALVSLRERLLAERSEWVARWGAHRYGAILEMIDVESTSVAVRAMRTERYDVSTRLREVAIHRIVEARLTESPGGTVINVGLTHAQKSGLFGTESTHWLGEFLVRDSPVTSGSVFVLGALAARVQEASAEVAQSQLEASPPNELLRRMHEARPDEAGFLPLTDPVFEEGGVPLNIEGTLYLCAPRHHFDGLVLYPLAHRDPAF